jgi:hypothetical protein
LEATVLGPTIDADSAIWKAKVSVRRNIVGRLPGRAGSKDCHSQIHPSKASLA